MFFLLHNQLMNHHCESKHECKWLGLWCFIKLVSGLFIVLRWSFYYVCAPSSLTFPARLDSSCMTHINFLAIWVDSSSFRHFCLLFLALCCMLISLSFHFSVDVWSVGCIMAEMVRGSVLFPGSDRILTCLSCVIHSMVIPSLCYTHYFVFSIVHYGF